MRVSLFLISYSSRGPTLSSINNNAMHFCKSRLYSEHLTLKLRNSILPTPPVIKYLGLHFDRTLLFKQTWPNWRNHASHARTFYRNRPINGADLRPWSSWTANSDKKLNVNKLCSTSQKTTFRKFCKIFCQFSRCHISFGRILKKLNANLGKILRKKIGCLCQDTDG